MFRISYPDQLVLSASDLTSHLACDHLVEQLRAVALGERSRWRPAEDPHAELTRERGDAHEREQLERLATHGYVDLTTGPAFTREALETGAERTAEAMRAGEPLIYQPLLFDGRWQGRADFLRRLPVESDLGDHSYEVLDTKLARHIKPYAVHQLLLYSRLVGEVQGRMPEDTYVVLGDGTEHRIELHRYAALHRHATRRLEHLVEAGPRDTYPEPVEHCAICPLQIECRTRRRADDHLSLVAGARREHRARLVDAGIDTVQALAHAPAEVKVPKVGAERLDLLRHQAQLQVRTWDDGGCHRRHLPAEHARGYARLPEPDTGDLFFDLEGDPYVGIEYLWGWCDAEGAYNCAWAHDATAEKAALERFVDLVTARRKPHPGMHVFHYAPHERSKLRSLAQHYGTREAEVDVLEAEGVLVDLYAVVRQGLQVGEESYGLKRLERHTGFTRTETTVREGGGSIVAYETWLVTREEAVLRAIRDYNADDCRSTLALRNWLRSPMKVEAARVLGCDFDKLDAPEPKEYTPPAWVEEQQTLADGLMAGLPDDPAADDADQAARRLLAQLMLFHHREGKPAWWRFFALCAMDDDQLLDERDAVAGLVPDPARPPVQATKQSTDWSYTFPPQEFKLDGLGCSDPKTGKSLNVQELTEDRAVIRRKTKDGPPTATAIIGNGAIGAEALREALAVIAREGATGAARSILCREAPRLADGSTFRQDGDPELGEMIATALALRGTHLVVQGPPGTGKTWRGARMIAAALAEGRRVAICAPSHAAIQNLLWEVELAAVEPFRGVYKGSRYVSPQRFIESVGDNEDTEDEDFQLVAGTPWLLARTAHRGQFGLVFIDEAGQMALANALAVSLCADSTVLLGDPQQLPQVTQGSHPGGSGASVLEHLLAGEPTIPADRGSFLTESWRMHPDVCAFVSERSYDGRLRSREACAQRAVDATGELTGAGLRVLAVDHEGRSQSSVEEAVAIAHACRQLLDGGTVTDDDGLTRDLVPADLMVVAPYNLAVRCIAEHVPDGVRVGTVDKFQGQQAPVVFYAMTCSSGDEVPRGLDFLFSRNRLNVAISRAQCLAILVHSPALLDADCRTLEAMELVDGACRFAELAGEQAGQVPA